MKNVLFAIFGAYEPVMTAETVTIGGVTQVVQRVAMGAAGVDWAYIAGVLLFALVLYCFFRLVGVLLK